MNEFDAFQARLEELFPGKVDDTARVDSEGDYLRENYLILTGAATSLVGDRQGRGQTPDDNAVWDFTVRAVGIDPGICRDMLKRARGLVGWVPDVDGRRCFAVRHTGSTKPSPDTSVRPPLFYADNDFSFRSHFTNAGS